MNAWQLMFLQSKANNNRYNGDGLAIQNWAWPQGTWFQKRLRQLRRKRPQTHMEAAQLQSSDHVRSPSSEPNVVPRVLGWTAQQGAAV